MKKFSKTFIKSAQVAIKILRANQNVIPEEGMGATTGAGSDCYPHTIVEVAPDFSYIIIQSDNHVAQPRNSFGGQQLFVYLENPNGRRTKYTLRKNGQYIADGVSMKSYWCRAHIGFRRYYQDPHF